MNKIDSAKLGMIEFQKKDCIHFSHGLFGFENCKNFLLIKNNGNDLFYYLQSVDDKSLTFILINPRMVFENYVLDIEESFLVNLTIPKIIDFSIVTITNDAICLNLMGPILIDIENQKGVQAITCNKNYTTKHKVDNFFRTTKTMKKAL